MARAPYHLLLVGLVCTCITQAQEFTTRTVLSNLRAPWEIVWGPDGQIYMTEFNGRISRVDPDNGVQAVLMERVPGLDNSGEAGLMGMTLAPDFLESREMYIAHAYSSDSRILVKVVRYNVESASLSNPTIIIEEIPGSFSHDGCRLALGPDGLLYITTGDAGEGKNAQQLSSINGRVLRLHPDGRIPSDNPWGTAVWSLGHRNAQGLTFGPNGVLYSSEHGPTSDDEVNIIERGRNYGWLNVEGFCDGPNEKKFCTDSNVKEPIGIVWTPTIAPGQLIYYSGDLFPQWKNHLLLCGMKDQSIIDLPLNEARTLVTGQSDIIRNTYGRTRAICQSPSGRIFFGSSNHDRYGDKRTNSDWLIEIVRTSDVQDEQSAVQITISADNLYVQGLAGGLPVAITDTQGRTVWSGVSDDAGTITTSLAALATAPYLITGKSADGASVSRKFLKP